MFFQGGIARGGNDAYRWACNQKVRGCALSLSKSEQNACQERNEMTAFTEWQNFYVIVGSSAGALIGLQFVVITLIADMPFRHGAEPAGHALPPPPILHVGAVLLFACRMRAPRRRLL